MEEFSTAEQQEESKMRLQHLQEERPLLEQERERLLLRQQQERAGRIASSFVASDFDPLWTNPHVQTIGGFLLRHLRPFQYIRMRPPTGLAGMMTWWRRGMDNPKDDMLSSKPFVWDKRERIDTPDGDWFHADSLVHPNSNNKGLVLLLHGLESNSDSSLSQDMARAFFKQGFSVTCLNFRGCTGTPNDTLGGYHLGFTDDLKHYLNILVRERRQDGHRDTPIYLAGFSLGANVVLKCLGELGLEANRRYKVQGAVSLCAPLDLKRNSPVLAQPGWNRGVYSANLLRSLKQRAREQLERHCDGNQETTKFDFARCMAAETITEFDDAFVAPVYGFEDVWDYYRQTSSINFVDSITVPTLLLNARDDPFMDPDYFPVERTVEGGGTAPIKMVGTRHGGHLGYVFHQVKDGEEIPETSWAPTELARFLAHTHAA